MRWVDRPRRLRALLRRPPPAPAEFTAAVVEHLADGVVACDVDGNFVTLNRRVREPAEGLPSASYFQDVRPEGWAAQFNLYPRGGARLLPTEELPLVRALRGETVRDMELETRGEHGARAALNVSGGPVLNSRGETIGAVVVIQDITERVEIEDRLWLQSAIVANIEAGVALIRARDGEIVYANDKWSRMFGYDSGELVGRPVSVVNAAGDTTPEERAVEIRDALERDGGWTGEVHNVGKDGRDFWTEANVSRFEHPTQGTLWVTAQTEIGERKAAEDELQRAEEHFRTVFEQAPIGMVLIGSDLRLLDFNDYFCSLVGYRRDDLVASPMAALAPPGAGDAEADLIAGLFSGDLPSYRIERRYLTRHGGTVPVTVAARLAYGADGQALYAVATVEELAGT